MGCNEVVAIVEALDHLGISIVYYFVRGCQRRQREQLCGPIVGGRLRKMRRRCVNKIGVVQLMKCVLQHSAFISKLMKKYDKSQSGNLEVDVNMMHE